MEPEGSILIASLAIMVGGAAALVLLLRKVRIPALLTYLFVGLLIEPVFSRLIPFFGAPDDGINVRILPETIDVIGEVGIALLLFIVGLELNLAKIRDVGKVAVIAGIGQVLFTAAGGYLLCLLLQFSPLESIFLSVALTFSSTVVVVKLLDQKREFDSLYGRIAVGIFLVQDLVVIVALTVLAGLSDTGGIQGSAIGTSLIRSFLGMAGLLGLSILAARFFLIKPFSWASRAADTLFIWSLSWCFLFVALARLLHISPELGAFLAGISLAQLKSSHDLRRRIHPLMNFFVAIFFISLGAQMELEAARQLWLAGTVLSLFVLIGNPLIFMWIIARCGYSEKTSFLTSVTVAQISEFSFVFVALGLSSGLIDRSILSLIALVGLVTIALSTYMILYNHALYEWARRWQLLRLFRASSAEEERPMPSLNQHVIVVGLNTLGRKIVQELHRRGETVLSIDRDPQKLDAVPGLKTMGSVEYLSVTDEAQLSNAKLGVSTLKIEDMNNVFAHRCKRLGVPVAIHAFASSVIKELEELEVEFIINSKRFGVEALIREIQRVKGSRR